MNNKKKFNSEALSEFTQQCLSNISEVSQQSLSNVLGMSPTGLILFIFKIILLFDTDKSLVVVLN